MEKENSIGDKVKLDDYVGKVLSSSEGKIQIYYMTQFQQECIREKNNYTFT